MNPKAEADTTTPVDKAQTENGVQPLQKEETELTTLMDLLKKEQSERERLEKELKDKNAKEANYENMLQRYKQIDPDQYERLVKEKKEREEQDLVRKQSWEELKDRYKQETEAKVKEADQWKNNYNDLLTRTAIERAFFEAGGRHSTFDLDSPGAEEIPPIEAINQILQPRTRIEESGRVLVLDRYNQTEYNAEGKPKTLAEKMAEIKKGSMGSLFEPENNASGGGRSPTTYQSGSNTSPIYSREQARLGKASIDAIASGKALVR